MEKKEGKRMKQKTGVGEDMIIYIRWIVLTVNNGKT
jgi:hypothetical protein